MVGLGLVVGHMIGDYVVQNDWMAKNKINPHPGYKPELVGKLADGTPFVKVDALDQEWAWLVNKHLWFRGHIACTVHCLCYTFAVWACSYWWVPWWGLVACFVIHWPIDRFRLAGRWMRNVSGQYQFATGPLAPWSIIVVDNTFHLLTLFVIGLVAGQR